MLALKNYQQKVLNDLTVYLKILDTKCLKNTNLNEIYNLYLQEQGKDIVKYKINKILGEVANVCLKIPTAGGKTFIAVNAIKNIFDNAKNYVNTCEKMVVWLVPSQSIYEQTLKNLSNNLHPYRQQLDSDFDNNVIVISKEEALYGKNFSPNLVENNLTILIITYDSLKGKKGSKEILNTHKENGYLINFKDKYKLDSISLMSVLQTLNPIVIIDESHNTKTDLSFDMLQQLNPSFILELTATPKAESNIISEIHSVELKAEQMVKLPLIVTNLKNKKDVYSSAKNMQESLENIANENEKNGGGYIRPIVLFQAENDIKNKENVNTTFKDIKKYLIDNLNIKESWIKIKTAEINELKGIDLLSKNCPVRYIITVNALKEGWDCPFAYILATMANKKSEIDVTQIVGRILRQPYAQNQSKTELNMSYIFTATNNFQTTLNDIVNALNDAGYEKSDCISYENIQNKQNIKLLNTNNNNNGNKNENKNENEINSTKNILNNANIANDEYTKNMQNKLNKNSIKVKEIFLNDIQNIKLPQFFLKSETFKGDLFDIALDFKNLLEYFDINKEDIKINFNTVLGEIYGVDYSDDSQLFNTSPLTKRQNLRMLELFSSWTDKTQQQTLLKNILNLCNDDIFNAIDTNSLRKYISRIIENYSAEQRNNCYKNLDSYAEKIKEKIYSLAHIEAREKFIELIQTNKIITKSNYDLKDNIEIIKTISWNKSLYKKEQDFTNNNLEKTMIEKILQNEYINIKWWHKNISKKGFCINGFLNHYPDFIIYTEKKNLILLETKGNHLEGNQDTKLKLELGEIWQNQSNNLNNKNTYGVDKYFYFMVFENEPTTNSKVAKSMDKTIELLENL